MHLRQRLVALTAVCLIGPLLALGSSPTATAGPTGPAGTPSVSDRDADGRAASKPKKKKSVLKQNRLNKAKQMTDAGCAPAAQIPLDTPANLLAYHASVLTCMDAAWAATWPKQLRKAGLKFKKPRLVVHNGDLTSRCYGPITLSYYCPDNRTIYMYSREITDPWAQFPTAYSQGLIRLSATHTLAHEYGHHLQARSGIFKAYAARYTQEKERRSELQASCLGNVFLSAQRTAYPILLDYAQRPESWRYIQVVNHGSVANQQLWTERGYASAKAVACNAWKAPKTSVS